MENLNNKISTMLQKNELSFEHKEIKQKNGFILYSKENINNCENMALKKLYTSCYKDIENDEENYIYRYFYYEKVNSSPLHATVVMMNPAFANSEKPDDTIKNIKKYLCSEYNQFGSFDIVNLYPVRMPKSAKLKSFLEQTKDETTKYQDFIKSYLKDSKNNENHIVTKSNYIDPYLVLSYTYYKYELCHFRVYKSSKRHKFYHLINFDYFEIYEKLNT